MLTPSVTGKQAQILSGDKRIMINKLCSGDAYIWQKTVSSLILIDVLSYIRGQSMI